MADELLLARRRRQRCSIETAGGKALVERRAGPLERAFDRALAAAEYRGRLGGVKTERVAEHERGSLAWRKMLQRRHERQPDGLPDLVPRLGSCDRVRESLEQCIWIGLEPRRLRHAGGPGRLDHRRAPRVGGACGREARSGSDWSRSGTATHVGTPGLRSVRAPATPQGESPGARPRRPERSPACGSSAAAARAGTGRPAPGRRPRRARGRG